MNSLRAAILLFLLALALAACGGAAEVSAPATSAEDDAAVTTPEATTPQATPTTEPAATDVTAFCESAVQAEMTSMRGPDIDFEKASPEEIEQALSDFSDELVPLLDAMMADVPEDVADEADTLNSLLRQALESGDDSIFESEEFRQADRALDAFVVDRCDYPVIEVQAVDYAFEGVPETVPAGTVGIDFRNAGAEVHEMALFRLNDDTTASVEELLAMPEEKAMQQITQAGHAFAMPDEGDIFFLELEPGEYGMVCFVPVGTTPANMEEMEQASEPGGPPHFTEGMFASFTVEG